MKKLGKVTFVVICLMVLFFGVVGFLDIFFPVAPISASSTSMDKLRTEGKKQWIIAMEEETGDLYAVPGKWAKPSKRFPTRCFIVTGEPIKIPDE